MRAGRSASVDRHHHVGRLDHGIGILALGKLELLDCLIGDRRGDDLSADVDLHMRCRGALGDVDDLALDDVTGAELHLCSPCGKAGAENPCFANICCPLDDTMNSAKRYAAAGLSFMTVMP